ncbi:hypothetical protein IMSAGC007_01981 [Lachnospiraceae bacterium]|nr:hypothetical protein IMSAGC007_01981 [Lachnospiraceae bacterium]
MNIGIAVFAYNRSSHLQQVLGGLQKNRNVEKLYLFQDGLKCEVHRKEWEKVKQVIKNIDWCETSCSFADVNKGLSFSIVNGVNRVLEENDAVVVLEDDCVPHSGFMTFMSEALQKYQNEKKVYSVSGYAYSVTVKNNGTDAYFTRRISSWGWGTWKDRWAYYQQDYKILGRIKNNDKLAEELRIWGKDLESYLLGNIYGSCDSWAVFWALTVIEQGGYCLSSNKGLIKNIGLDGTGVHCGVVELPQYLYKEEKKRFLLPDTVKLPDEYKEVFGEYFSWVSGEKKLKAYNELLLRWVDVLIDNRDAIAENLNHKQIYKCSIWGKGPLCDLLLKELSKKIEVLSIIESNPIDKSYKGIPVTKVENIPKDTQLIIVIPTYDFSRIKKMAEKVTDCKIVPLDFILR